MDEQSCRCFSFLFCKRYVPPNKNRKTYPDHSIVAICLTPGAAPAQPCDRYVRKTEEYYVDRYREFWRNHAAPHSAQHHTPGEHATITGLRRGHRIKHPGMPRAPEPESNLDLSPPG